MIIRILQKIVRKVKLTDIIPTILSAGLITFGLQLNSQTVIYTTDFGTVANINPAGWTFSGVGMNISTNNASAGYTGASGGACLGEGNSVTFTNTSGNSQISSPLGYSEGILQVSTTGYSTVALSFGMRKSSAGYNTNATYSLQYSTNGITYTDIIYTEPTAGSWGLASGSGLNLPPGATNQPTLYLKWAFNRTGTASNYKLDDVTLTGNIPPLVPASISFLSSDTTVSESSNTATVYVRLVSPGNASAAVTISVSSLSNASPTDYTLVTQTVTFAPNAPVNTVFPVIININNDATIESGEYVILTLTNTINASVTTNTLFAFYIGDNDKPTPAPSNALALNLLSSFSNGAGGSNSAEIVVHDPTTQRLYIANSIGGKLDIIDFVNPSAPVLLNSISILSYGNINSVAVRNGTVAAAIENSNPQDSGKVVFFNANGAFLKQVKVGMMPDMITFNNAGTKVITANEGEPNAAYTNDPDGSVSIINISGGISSLTQTNVAHATFTAYNGQEPALRALGIRIFGLNATTSKDFEPEYVAVSKDDTRAWITLQENNAIAEISLITNSVVSIRCLGTKDHSLLNNGFDASNTTKGVNISNFPVKGIYMPDAIVSYTVGGVDYIITANEGDTRAYSGFSEEVRVSALTLDPVKFPLSAQLKNNSVLGRLTITNKTGDIDNDNDIDTIYSLGSRSFSIWNASTGVQVYDSKDDFEQITASNSFSVLFNASNSNSIKKDRSDDKGPEPEGVTLGIIGANTYAFIALERIGGVMVYDVTVPAAPVFVTYVNNRSLPSGGPDTGAEGIIFIAQSQSPNGQHLVIAANEVSSNLSIWGIPGCSTPLSSSIAVTGPTTNICSNNTPVLSVPSGTNLSFQWSLNGTPISGATSNSLMVGQTGSYSVAITGGTNCSTGSTLRTYSVNVSPTLAVFGSTFVCLGGALTQTATGASTYTWNNSLSGSVVNLVPTSSSVFTIVATGTNNCVSTITRTISVVNAPTLTITSSSATVCEGNLVTLTASGASTYTWNTGALTSSITVTPQLSTTYLVNGANSSGCVNSAANSITVNPAPLIQLSSTAGTICSGQTVVLSATGASSYSWNASAGGASISISPASTTNYTISGVGSNNCKGSSQIIIVVNPTPTLSISSTKQSMCSGESATLNVVGALNYMWANGVTGPQVVISPTATSSYSVTGTNSLACAATANISQEVLLCTGLNIESEAGSSLVVFPNPGTGRFTIKSDSPESLSVSIFDATGRFLFAKTNYLSNSELDLSHLGQGIYFFHIKSGSFHQIKKVIKE